MIKTNIKKLELFFYFKCVPWYDSHRRIQLHMYLSFLFSFLKKNRTEQPLIYFHEVFYFEIVLKITFSFISSSYQTVTKETLTLILIKIY